MAGNLQPKWRAVAPRHWMPAKKLWFQNSGKNNKAQGKCDEIEYRLEAQNVMNIRGDLCQVCGAKRWKCKAISMSTVAQNEPDAGERCQQAKMAEMRNAFGRSDAVLRPRLK